MSDRAPGSVVIYAYPEKNTDKILDVLASYHLSEDLSWPANVEPLTLVAGRVYMDDDMVLGDDEDIANKLANLGCTFTVQQDAKYEFDGTVHMYAPSLGMFRSTGSQEGEVLVEAHLIDKALEATSTPQAAALELIAALDRLTGKAWRDRIAELSKQLKEA